MSTMRRPEMEVVRFKEADVIVASVNIATLSGFGDGESGNGNVRYGTTDYNHSIGNVNQFPWGTGIQFNNEHEERSIGDLFDMDHFESVSGYLGDWDGDYTYINGKFHRQ